jgi:hypothetical protein
MSIGIRAFPPGNILNLFVKERHDFSRDNNNNLRIEKESKALLQIIIQGIGSYEFIE